MTILRPVTKLSPSNRDVLDDCGLPFSFVLTPFARRSAISQGDDDKFNQKHLRKARDSTRPTTKIRERASDAYPTKASLIAKCTYCGSPLNPMCRFIDQWCILCNICRRTYDADFESQSKLRRIPTAGKPFVDRYDRDNDYMTMSQLESEYRKRYGQNGSKEECEMPLVEYSLPLLTVHDPETQSEEDIFALPANLCPPLLAVFIDGTSNDGGYYERISRLLMDMLEDSSEGGYKGTRMGIFVMTSGGGLSIYDFTNPGGHLKHLWIDSCPLTLNSKFIDPHGDFVSSMDDQEDFYKVAPLEDVMTAEQIFAPLDGNGRVSVENALREIADWTITIRQGCQRGDHEHSGGVCLGRTLQYFLDFMERVAYQPGDSQRINQDHDGVSGDDSVAVGDNFSDKFLFAGGKIFCFLSQAPYEVGNFNISDLNGRAGLGGFGGSCAEIGKRFSADIHENMENRMSEKVQTGKDIEMGGVETQSKSMQGVSRKSKRHTTNGLPETRYLQVDEYYQDIGVASAMGAFAIEIFTFLQSDQDLSEDDELYIGIPILRLLSDRSGGCGPLLSILPKLSDNNIYGSHQNDDVILHEVIARSPWKRMTAFGAMLRIRCSRSLKVDDCIQNFSLTRGSNKLAEFYHSNGLFGAAATSLQDDELYLMGACDTTHTLTFDLTISSRNGVIEDTVLLDGIHEVTLAPGIQTCFAYTSVVKNGSEWVTVRRLRVLTQELQVTEETESIFSSLDTEALAVPMFHKFQHYSLQHGFLSLHEYASNWILNVLLCCYKSAQKQQERVNKYGHGIIRGDFFAADRILGIQGSTMSKKEVLLAQGHEELQSLPLLVFSLIQCDPLRPNDRDFNPSLDARSAASANMSNMTPDVIARCIAPRIELWSSDVEGISYGVGMNTGDIHNTILSHFETHSTNEFPILFVDTPSNIILDDCQNFGGQKCHTDTKMEDLPPALNQAKFDALKSYRVTPPVYSSFSKHDSPATPVSDRLADCLVEDSVSSVTHMPFGEWCNAISDVLYSEIFDN